MSNREALDSAIRLAMERLKGVDLHSHCSRLGLVKKTVRLVLVEGQEKTPESLVVLQAIQLVLDRADH